MIVKRFISNCVTVQTLSHTTKTRSRLHYKLQIEQHENQTAHRKGNLSYGNKTITQNSKQNKFISSDQTLLNLIEI